ncbi:hypothetical protein [Rhizobium leguminosarum]|uniref:hypothetical protein n=1 Tax=Rhizobium leguminosarum TaxID=384 RepID=UPI0021BBC682|nr:hypothetical protein [Rhizobium leguminosarum]
MITNDRWRRPGWLETLTGLIAYRMLIFLFALLMGLLPSNDAVVLGVVGSTAHIWPGSAPMILKGSSMPPHAAG